MQAVAGVERYGDIKIHKTTLREATQAIVGAPWQFRVVQPDALKETLTTLKSARIIIWPAAITPLNATHFKLLLSKLVHAQTPVRIHTAGPEIYAGPAHFACDTNDTHLQLDREESLLHLTDIHALQTLFSVNIHARYFNQVVSTGKTITKRSKQKVKMLAEYTLLTTLPKPLQPYFVEAFNFRETANDASYTMPKLAMLDSAMHNLNGNLEGSNLTRFLHVLTPYLQTTHAYKRKATEETYAFIVGKCQTRLEELKTWEGYAALESFLAMHSPYTSLQAAIDDLTTSLGKEKKQLLAAGETFSHGDFCLSNILYDPEAGMIKLIDPRGGKASDSLRSPYYDMAKLSHSLLGGYDFIINRLATLSFDDAMQAAIVMPIDHKAVTAQFMPMVAREGLSFRIVRLVEASLFLSMLPLHTESPRKVHMLALRGMEILREAKQLKR